MIRTDLSDRITEYLNNGGLFNPEMMDHEKVRDLLMDCREVFLTYPRIQNMEATAQNGDVWTGESQDGFWLYRDKAGNIYESKEVPAYRIMMDNATQQVVNGKPTITPICAR